MGAMARAMARDGKSKSAGESGCRDGEINGESEAMAQAMVGVMAINDASERERL